jgi:GNAT superfamily N-acetyltransferase
VNVRGYRPDEDRAWAEAVLDEHLGGALQARRGQLHDVLALPGFVAEHEGGPVGILTYRMTGDECELAVLLALERAQGIGSALVDALVEAATGCTRIWVVTTNDNLDALRFYQRRGFRLTALRPGAVDEARRALKPQIGRRL